jgi:hypothetical protein
MVIQGSNLRLTVPNVRTCCCLSTRQGSGHRHGAGSSPLDYAASRRIGHPAKGVCLPRLNITCHILRYHWNHYPNRIGRPAGTVLSQNLFQPVTLWRTGARGIHDWRRRLWQAGRVSQRFSLRLATLRARAKASALRILCCWLMRSGVTEVTIAAVAHPAGDCRQRKAQQPARGMGNHTGRGRITAQTRRKAVTTGASAISFRRDQIGLPCGRSFCRVDRLPRHSHHQ